MNIGRTLCLAHWLEDGSITSCLNTLPVHELADGGACLGSGQRYIVKAEVDRLEGKLDRFITLAKCASTDIGCINLNLPK